MKKTAKQALGAELRRLRIAAGLTQWEVASSLEYSTAQFVSNWERGRSAPPYSALTPLAGALGVARQKLVSLVIDTEKAELEERHRQLLTGT